MLCENYKNIGGVGACEGETFTTFDIVTSKYRTKTRDRCLTCEVYYKNYKNDFHNAIHIDMFHKKMCWKCDEYTPIIVMDDESIGEKIVKRNTVIKCSNASLCEKVVALFNKSMNKEGNGNG